MPDTANSQAEKLEQTYFSRNLFMEWLRSPIAFSMPVAILFFLNNFATGFAFSNTDLAIQPEIPVHIFDLLTGLSGAAVILLAGRLTNKRTQMLFSYATVFTVWAIGALVALFTPLTIEIISTGHGINRNVSDGYLSGFTSYVGQFLRFTIIVAAISSMRQASRNLAQARYKLRHIQANVAAQLVASRAEIRQQAAEQIQPTLQAISQQLHGLQATQVQRNDGINQALTSAINDVIRPISHTLGMSASNSIEPIIVQFTDSEIQSVDEIRKDISRFSLRSRLLTPVSLGAMYEPFLALIFLCLFELETFIFLVDLKSALLVCIPSFIAITLSTYLAKRIFSGIHIAYLLNLLIGILSLTIISGWFLFFMNIFLPSQDELLAIPLLIGVAMIQIWTGYFGLVVARRVTFLEQAHVINNSISDSLSTMRHELLIAQRQLGRLLHGGVQARIQAAYLRLNRVTSIDNDVLTDVTKDISDAQLMLTETQSPISHNLGELMDDLIDFWAGVCDVDVQMTREIDELVSLNPVSVQCVTEVVREALSNAVKHDHADTAEVHLSLLTPKLLKLTVSHDLNSVVENKDSAGGLGNEIYAELTRHWQLSFTDNDVVLTAEFIISQ